VLKNLLVFVDSNADLLRRVWSLSRDVRGNEHRPPLLETLICYAFTSLMDLTELSIILDEVLHIIALLVFIAAFRVFVLILDARSDWNNVSVFFKIEIVTLLLPHVIFKNLYFLRRLRFDGIITNLNDFVFFDYVIFLALLVCPPGSILATRHLIDLVKSARL